MKTRLFVFGPRNLFSLWLAGLLPAVPVFASSLTVEAALKRVATTILAGCRSDLWFTVSCKRVTSSSAGPSEDTGRLWKAASKIAERSSYGFGVEVGARPHRRQRQASI